MDAYPSLPPVCCRGINCRSYHIARATKAVLKNRLKKKKDKKDQRRAPLCSLSQKQNVPYKESRMHHSRFFNQDSQYHSYWINYFCDGERGDDG
mmetsp:Transcript_29954/g.55986  ORF Transcript_29954/g.55986 Transcript_29954/m.55986 type:complete len:94 (+) Transcript_29954:464-745(+)